MGCGSSWARGCDGEGNSHFAGRRGVNWGVGETGLGAVSGQPGVACGAKGVCDPGELIVALWEWTQGPA